jgi:hypothetical protein
MTTMQTNGKLRKSLAEQIDRLDGILDGLANALNESVAAAVKDAVGAAVREAVLAVLAEVVANPAVLALLHGGAPPPEVPMAPPATRVGQRLRRGWAFLTAGVRTAVASCRALCGRIGHGLASAGKRVAVVRHFKLQVLTALGVGFAAGTAAHFAGPWVASVAGGLGGFATALAVQAWLWLRRMLGGPAFGQP